MFKSNCCPIIFVAALVVVMLGVLDSSVCLGVTGARVRVTQIKASNDGDDSVDLALGDLGLRLKRKYRYRNFKLFGSSTRSVGQGQSTTYALANGMILKVKLLSVEKDTVKLSISFVKGDKALNSFTAGVRNGATFLTSIPWNRDLLILAIRVMLPVGPMP